MVLAIEISLSKMKGMAQNSVVSFVRPMNYIVAWAIHSDHLV